MHSNLLRTPTGERHLSCQPPSPHCPSPSNHHLSLTHPTHRASVFLHTFFFDGSISARLGIDSEWTASAPVNLTRMLPFGITSARPHSTCLNMLFVYPEAILSLDKLGSVQGSTAMLRQPKRRGCRTIRLRLNDMCSGYR